MQRDGGMWRALLCFGLLDLGLWFLASGVDRATGPEGALVAIGLLGQGAAAVLTGIYLAATTGRRVGTGQSWFYALLFVMISRVSLFALFWLPEFLTSEELSVSEAVFLALLMAFYPAVNFAVILYLLVIWLGFVLGQRLVRVG